MKLQNIFALIVTLIGFAACTSESELPDTLVNGDLVPVTISLGSMQTKASVGLDTDEGTIQNAVIAIFDNKGIPTIAPIVLNASNSGTTRLPLVESNAYAFVNVSNEDIAALETISDETEFRNYTIKKALTQDASALPKYGEKMNFTPTANGNIAITVKQLTARVEAMVDIKVIQDENEITEHGLSFSKSNLSWTNMKFKSGNTQTDGIDGLFTTIINGMTYTNVFNRAYTYPGTNPLINLTGSISGTMNGFTEKQVSLSYTFPNSLIADNVHLVKFIVKVDVTQPANPTFTYEVIPMEKVAINVPSFD
ncbi:hypothetical protein [Parabacteroides faecis]|uniref:DUF1735 domain-containing protein n=1 Tax=Parabacteroides faecis TaxID=1217282 RepID=A0ABR6KG21_9BACT|nr:hypothetical protein [Parabacteroides faecis]MBB4620452.1 hypothetical protein [Parabacteroides faecis]GGK04948.1 hypothetical protein GCM10007084_30230 [Parabacteroides faecis]